MEYMYVQINIHIIYGRFIYEPIAFERIRVASGYSSMKFSNV